jgi:hypothetical protein
MNLSRFKFRSSPNDRVTDNRAQWYLRMDDLQRANSPRQRRLKAERQFMIARYHETISAIAGGILLGLLILCLFMFL